MRGICSVNPGDIAWSLDVVAPQLPLKRHAPPTTI
jgi:hypothetical protein